MEYNIKDIRLIADRYFKGETSLAEEAALREYFDSGNEIPADLEACRILFGQSAAVAAERPHRKLKLRSEPVRRPLRRWMGAAAGIAAAILVAVFVTVDFNGSHTGGFVCYVDGEQITDPAMVMDYTRGAFDIINATMQKPNERTRSAIGRVNANLQKSENTLERVNSRLQSLVSEE